MIYPPRCDHMRLVDILDMLDFRAQAFVIFFEQLNVLIEQASRVEKQYGASKIVPSEIEKEFQTMINTLRDQYAQAGLTVRELKGVSNLLFFQGCTCKILGEMLRSARRQILDELESMIFLRIPSEHIEYYKNPKAFGDEVYQKFPGARLDIQEANNCFATDRYTACVFHLMRVAEHGLRALTKKLKIKFKVAVEFETWERIIKAIETETQKIAGQPKTLKRQADLEFYSGAAAQFRYFKDAWRNHVMHTRTNYYDQEALMIMLHTRDFMRHLALKVKG